MGVPPSKIAKFQASLQEAARHQQAGQLVEAERVLRRVLRERPSHAEANFMLGIVLKDQGKEPEAEAAFRRVTAVAPDAVGGHNNLGGICYKQGKLAEAEAAYRRALALNPEMIDAL